MVEKGLYKVLKGDPPNFLIPKGFTKKAPPDKFKKEWEARPKRAWGPPRGKSLKVSQKGKGDFREEVQLIIKKRLAPVGIKGSVKKDDIAKAIKEQTKSMSIRNILN